MKLLIEVDGQPVEFTVRPNHLTSEGHLYILNGFIGMTDFGLKSPNFEENLDKELEDLRRDMRKAFLEFKKQNNL